MDLSPAVRETLISNLNFNLSNRGHILGTVKHSIPLCIAGSQSPFLEFETNQKHWYRYEFAAKDSKSGRIILQGEEKHGPLVVLGQCKYCYVMLFASCSVIMLPVSNFSLASKFFNEGLAKLLHGSNEN